MNRVNYAGIIIKTIVIISGVVFLFSGIFCFLFVKVQIKDGDVNFTTQTPEQYIESLHTNKIIYVRSGDNYISLDTEDPKTFITTISDMPVNNYAYCIDDVAIDYAVMTNVINDFIGDYEISESVPAKVELTDGQVTYVNAIPRRYIIKDKLIDAINEKANNKDASDNIVNVVDFIVTEDLNEDLSLSSKIDKLNNFYVEYTNGYKLDISDFIECGLVNIDTLSITGDTEILKKKLINNLSDYNTVERLFDFTTHKGKDISVKSVTYGDYISIADELNAVMQRASTLISEDKRIPAKKQDATYALDDTYIEVDKTEQHAYYFEGGELVWDSDIVTGLPTKERETPNGVYFIYNKAKDADLVGEGYDVKVDYWMSVTYTGVGFHDANWRNKFGGTIYKSNGSHGCINTPIDKMEELYSLVKMNTPVVIY